MSTRARRVLLTLPGLLSASLSLASPTVTEVDFDAILGEPLQPATWVQSVEELLPQAFPSEGDLRSLEELVDFGLTHDAGLRAAFERWRAARQRVPQAGALPDPQLTFVQFLENLQTRTGPQRRQVGLSQRLPAYGERRLRAERAERRAHHLRWLLEDRRHRLVRDITRAFLDHAHLARDLRITQDSLELLQRIEPVVQRRVQTGDGQEGLLRLLVEIGRLESDLQSLQARRPVLSARLDALLNREPATPMPFAELTEPGPWTFEPAAMTDRLEKANPRLQALRVQLTVDETGRELARVEGRPETTVGLTWFDTGSLDSSVSGSGDDPVAVSVSLSLPVWRERYRAARLEAEHEQAATLLDLRHLQATLRAELAEATFRHDDAARQVRLYRDSLMPRARQALVVTEAAYRAGTAEVLELIDSQQVLLRFERAYWREVRDQRHARADLRALLGGDLP